MAKTDDLSGEELEAALTELTQKLERVRILYEQFFLGTERQPPTQAHKQVVRLVYQLQRAKLRGAAQKFRFQSLMQRYSSHKAYWSRTLREIEEGRYKRQTVRAESRAERRQRSSEEDDAGELTIADYLAIRTVKDMEGEDAAARVEEERRKARQKEANAAADFLNDLKAGRVKTEVPRGVAQPSKPAPDVRGMSAEDIAKKADQLKEMRRRMKGGEEAIQRRRAAAAQNRGEAPAPRPDADRVVYDRLVDAKRSLNQDTSALSFDAVRNSLAKQRDKVREKHQCARVDFDVVVKDGKAFLKPIPVKDS